MQPTLTLVKALPRAGLTALAKRYSLELIWIADHQPIPGSYWGESEAGMIQSKLYIRSDTPVHSFLHEMCHIICMDSQRRQCLHTDAGGEYAEEDAVCYLQIVLADELPQFGRQQAWQDMDTWGYTFRLGSAQAWFEQDAEDAKRWLIQHQLLTSEQRPIFQLRA